MPVFVALSHFKSQYINNVLITKKRFIFCSNVSVLNKFNKTVSLWLTARSVKWHAESLTKSISKSITFLFSQNTDRYTGRKLYKLSNRIIVSLPSKPETFCSWLSILEPANALKVKYYWEKTMIKLDYLLKYFCSWKPVPSYAHVQWTFPGLPWTLTDPQLHFSL